MVEHLHGKEGVKGSIPFSGSGEASEQTPVAIRAGMNGSRALPHQFLAFEAQMEVAAHS